VHVQLPEAIRNRLRAARKGPQEDAAATRTNLIETQVVPGFTQESPAKHSAYLFVQSFGDGSIASTGDEPGLYTLTLSHGLGYTLFFADRPSRDAGVTPTAEFLDGLGFPDDNPPNAALIIDSPDGAVISTVQLFRPTFDPDSPGVTYEVREIDESVAMDPTVATMPLADLAESFGRAHLFIDDCPDGPIACVGPTANYIEKKYFESNGRQRIFGYCWNYSQCMPCDPYGHNQPYWHAALTYWTDQCNATFPDFCNGHCFADPYGDYS
jgi:hypothetical protein